MHKLTYSFLVCAVFALSACGGGGNDSSGGGGGGGGSGPPAGVAGTYTGPATVTVSVGGQSETVTETITVIVDAQGNANIQGTNINTTFNGNSFSGTTSAAQGGLPCAGSITINGTVSGDTITGTISGNNVVCDGIPVNISGNFTLTKVSGGRAPLEFLGETKNAIRNMTQ